MVGEFCVGTVCEDSALGGVLCSVDSHCGFALWIKDEVAANVVR